ncbi:MAG: S-methyl-5'-thioadenosine phosphorylase [Thermomicrobiales bacterium]
MGKLGIIGGSGIYELEGLADGSGEAISTPFGETSGPVKEGRIGVTDVCFIPRHGPGHRYSPTAAPYRANVYALKRLGVTHLLSFSAVGSLREALPPRTIVLPDQLIDRTVNRPRTFFDGGVVAHIGIADPYCQNLNAALLSSATTTKADVVKGGVYVCIEGPQFSTRAESELYRSWGGDIIGMTAMPEARLAREAELCYAAVAMVTDFDVWHSHAADVTVDEVVANMRANGAAARELLAQFCVDGLPARSCSCSQALNGAIMTHASAVTATAHADLDLLVGDRWPA